jgi:hypothetical protein
METGGSNPADMVAGPEELQSMEGLKTLQWWSWAEFGKQVVDINKKKEGRLFRDWLIFPTQDLNTFHDADTIKIQSYSL